MIIQKWGDIIYLLQWNTRWSMEPSKLPGTLKYLIWYHVKFWDERKDDPSHQNKVKSNNRESNWSYNKLTTESYFSNISLFSITGSGWVSLMNLKIVPLLTPLLRWTGLVAGQIMDWIWKEFNQGYQGFVYSKRCEGLGSPWYWTGHDSSINSCLLIMLSL